MHTKQNSACAISCRTTQRMIGLLGIALPIMIVAGGLLWGDNPIQGSISGYYYTNMRDLFVLLMFSIALFMYIYKGYDRIENIITNVCGLSVLGVICFPAYVNNTPVIKAGIFLINTNISGHFHSAFAACFFMMLALIPILLFSKNNIDEMTKLKRKRNTVYRFCGIIIIIATILISLCSMFFQQTIISTLRPIVILETVIFFAFGASWLIKGGVLLKDKDAPKA